jgi:hypothetical protein
MERDEIDRLARSLPLPQVVSRALPVAGLTAPTSSGSRELRDGPDLEPRS